jgi:hypothetical protein
MPFWTAPNQNYTDFHILDFEDTTTRTRRRPFQDPGDRAQTAQTRRDNACLRCRMQRIRVSFSPIQNSEFAMTVRSVCT